MTPRHLTWTTSKPTVAGWYWFSFPEPRIVKLEDSKEGLYAEGFLVHKAKHYWDGEWSGPMLPPEDPSPNQENTR